MSDDREMLLGWELGTEERKLAVRFIDGSTALLEEFRTAACADNRVRPATRYVVIEEVVLHLMLALAREFEGTSGFPAGMSAKKVWRSVGTRLAEVFHPLPPPPPPKVLEFTEDEQAVCTEALDRLRDAIDYVEEQYEARPEFRPEAKWGTAEFISFAGLEMLARELRYRSKLDRGSSLTFACEHLQEMIQAVNKHNTESTSGLTKQ